jgi:Uri superfamily endonuclease
MPHELPAKSGVYLLQLVCPAATEVTIGQLGSMQLVPGIYLYVGSAHGPGGLRARLSHHLRPARRPHWHLDYLRRHCQVSRIWYSTALTGKECQWATAAGRIRSCRTPFPGFGASDCRCLTHLFWRQRPPALTTFRHKLNQLTGCHTAVSTLPTF